MAVALLAWSGCERLDTDLDNLPCERGQCLQGYVCNTDTNRCVRVSSPEAESRRSEAPTTTDFADDCPRGVLLPGGATSPVGACDAAVGCDDDDGDGACNDGDLCAGDDAAGDTDGDGVCDDRDDDDDDDGWSDVSELACGTEPKGSGSFPLDMDEDGVCSALDACVGDDGAGDFDADGLCNDVDHDDDGDGWSDAAEMECGADPTGSSSRPGDADGDGLCDLLDACPGGGLGEGTGDHDGDGICDEVDECEGDDGSCEAEDWVWEEMDDMPYAATHLTSAVLSDGLHVLSGAEDWEEKKVHRDHYVYDASSGGWSSVRKLPGSANGAQAQVFDDRLYLVGGTSDGRALWVYSPRSDEWDDSLPEVPKDGEFEYGFVSAVVDSALYLVGGHPGPERDAPAFKFDLVQQEWSQCADIPDNRGEGTLTGAAVGRNIYVLSGDAGGRGTALQIYDTETDSWSQGEGLDRHYHRGAAVAYGRKIYFIGGGAGRDSRAPEEVADTVSVYDTVRRRWRTERPMPTARAYATAQLVDGEIHVMGGLDDREDGLPVHEVLMRAR